MKIDFAALPLSDVQLLVFSKVDRKSCCLDHVTKRIYTQQQKMKMYHLPGYNLLSW